LAVRFCPVNLRTPYRFDNRDSLPVYAVYATEIDCPEDETPVEWMLLTTEVVADIQAASTILRWYTYRWRVEEYHKIFKSGCQVERYRLAAEGMKTLVGFLSVIAVELLQLTYLHRTQPSAPAIEILNPLELRILKAKSSKLPKVLTVSWAVEAVARLGGYLEHQTSCKSRSDKFGLGEMKLVIVESSNKIKPQTKSFSTISISKGQNFKYLQFPMYMFT